MKMWSGRFEKATNELVDAFNASLPFDIRLFEVDIEASIAHCAMLAKCGILTAAETDRITCELKNIAKDITDGKIMPEGEDVHMFVEGELTARIGAVGKKLHTARSRNDQVATDFRLYVMRAESAVQEDLKVLIQAILQMATAHTQTVMSGYTHLQKAQPVTLAHYLMAYAEMFSRDFDRLDDAKKRANVLPLGCCALAGTTYPIDREYTASLLGFESVCQNSIDGVSDRDFAAEFLFALSLIAMHLSRFSEEIILWNSDEFGYIELDDAFATGSSIMPQKKNPDIPELIRGKTGRVYGDLIQMLTMLKGLPLAYNKDMQEDKESVFDAFDTVHRSLIIFASMLETSKFNREKLQRGADRGYTNATEVADYLVNHGIPFRDAHEITGKLVLSCIKRAIPIGEMTIEEFKQFSPVFNSDVFDAVNVENAVKRRKVTGAPAPETVNTHIQAVAKKFNLKI